MTRVEDYILPDGRLKSEVLAKAKVRAEKKRMTKKRVTAQQKRRRETLKWRKTRKAELMAKEVRFTIMNGMFWFCPLGEHWMRKEQVELCHARCSGMRGDGDSDENTFLGCRNGNRSQGSVSLERYLEKPLSERRKLCGLEHLNNS